MFANYLLTALQGLLRQPVFSAIKVLSLAVGLGCSILVLLHVQYAGSHDKHFPNWENTYRLVSSFNTDQRMNTEINADPWGPQLLLDYPQIDKLARIRQNFMLFSRGDIVLGNGIFFADPDIVDIFALDFVRGDAATALAEPNTLIVNETTAEKYFPGEDPVGQTLTVDNRADLRVTGVYRDLPKNTHLDFPMFTHAGTGRQLFGEFFMDAPGWFLFQGTRTYLTIPDRASAEALSADLEAFMARNLPDNTREFAQESELRVYLESIGDIYFSPFVGFGGSNPRPRILLGLSLFAFLILATSSINFANLSMSQIRQRAKEIGVRKTLGAGRPQIVAQFLVETLLLTGLALLIALPFVYLAIGPYTALTGTGFTAASLLEGSAVSGLLLFVLAVGLLSGLLPALALARFEPASIIKGVSIRGRLSRALRSGVTVLQFGFATALIILALAIGAQIEHLNTMDLGFDRTDLLVTASGASPTASEETTSAFLDELRQHPGILSVTTVNAPPPNVGPLNPWSSPSLPAGETRGVRHIVTDEHYLEAMGLELLAGRNFSPDFPSDFLVQGPPAEGAAPREAAAVITRWQVSNFGFGTPEEALGKIVDLFGNPARVIGVVEDFRLSGGLEDPLQSTGIIRATSRPLGGMLVKLAPGQQEAALEHIDAAWARHYPDRPVNRSFYDQTFSVMVTQQTSGLSAAAVFASIITVLISAFGLYALAFYTGQRRTKEVGVRKVCGATSRSIVRLFTWDFLKPVLAACALAAVGAWFAVALYLQQFSSRAEISPLLYLAAMAGTLLVAVLTVAAQCFRSANADPVKSLRYE